MDIEKALEIKKALIVLAEALDADPKTIASAVCFFLDKGKYERLVEASDKWNEFDNATLVERGKMFGITITECIDLIIRKE